MPVAEHSSPPVRGQRTICIPCSQEQYERIVDDPAQFRACHDRQIEATPGLFPQEIRQGYRMKDLYTSRKTGWKLRRIELRNLRCYLIRPSFLMPYLSGRTEYVQSPLFYASSPSRTRRSPKSSADRPCTGIAWNAPWGGSAWSGRPSRRPIACPATWSPTRSTPPWAGRRSTWRPRPVPGA